MNPSPWPDGLEETLWAKSAEKGAGGRPESLPRHTWSVLRRLTEFIRLRPSLPQKLGMPRLWHVLFWAAFLHDFGKSASGFQDRLRGGEPWPHRHEVLSLAFVDWVVDGLSPAEQAWLVAAIVSHHRDAEEIHCRYRLIDDTDEDPLVARVAEIDEVTTRKLWGWLQTCAAAWIRALGLDELGVAMPLLPDVEDAVRGVVQHGAVRIRHWLRIFRRFANELEDDEPESPGVTGAIILRGYMVNSDHSASAHAGRLPQVDFRATDVFGATDRTPYYHQQCAARADGSALLVAPTGSGKTEAALLWAVRQAEANGGLPRLFYTLPYQASMNAMRQRLAGIFPDRVGLQHGRSLLALYRMLLEEEAITPEEAARHSRRSRNLARLNYPPIRVFSPYQMLKGMYRLKGYEALLSDYYGAAFIFDEIHAYEVKRMAIILATIRYLAQAFDARFMVMSATFPSLIRGWLRDALQEPAEIAAEAKLFEDFRRHRLVLLDGEIMADAAIERIAQDALAGKSVLVVCTLVDRAQAVYARLRERLSKDGVQVELLHGRFNMQDRSTKEQLVRERVGAGVTSQPSLVLVATQVVEVSLDIDIDTLYSEPAPLEALVQRFGRINRRCRQAGLAPVHVFRQPDDGQFIYDEVLVQRTLALLECHVGQPIDEADIGGWLDRIYSGDVAERWRAAYARAVDEFEGNCVNYLRPFASDRDLEALFYQAFDGVEVLPQSLLEQYRQYQEEDPILAGELLVSIGWRRYHTLKRDGLLVPRDGHVPPVVMVPYSAELGLTFENG